LVCTFLFVALAGFAWLPVVAGESPRIGYVDMKRLLDNAPQVLAGREQLDREFRPRNESIIADEARLLRLQEQAEVDEDLSEEERESLAREARNLQRSITRRREDLREELQFRRDAAVKALEEEVNLAVQAVAREDGFDLILSSPAVLFASDPVDITDRILRYLENEFEN